MVLFAPCVRPHAFASHPLVALLRLASTGGLGHAIVARFPHDLSRELLTHSPPHLLFWSQLRAAFPRNLRVEGNTARFVHALWAACEALRTLGPQIHSDVLIFTAGADNIVDNVYTEQFALTLQSPAVRLVRFSGAYHELLIETDDVLKHIHDETTRFFQSSDDVASGDSSFTSNTVSKHQSVTLANVKTEL